jgi:REP-associated tyrosine transposase
MDHKGWHSRGYLPHFDSQDVVQFVTFRLADSLPKEAATRVRHAAQPESLRDEILDKGLGACWLENDGVAKLVENALLIFDADRYRVHGWTIMPNHVHVLLSVLVGYP